MFNKKFIFNEIYIYNNYFCIFYKGLLLIFPGDLTLASLAKMHTSSSLEVHCHQSVIMLKSIHYIDKDHVSGKSLCIKSLTKYI